MFKKTLERGFTLIELLVVIAIIGILAAVVLASLNDARSSGANASVKQQMASMRAQAEIYYNQNGFRYYVDTNNHVCRNVSGAPLHSLMNGALTQSPASTIVLGTQTTNTGTAAQIMCRINTGTGAWAVSAPLHGGTGANQRYWCVDSTGSSRQTAAHSAVTANVVCPAEAS